jgi:predicted kinase
VPPPRPLPPAVVVGGAPGSGKTTLARRLGGALALPVLTKDDFKESLYETLGAPDQAASALLGRAAIHLLYGTSARLLEAGTGVVLESAFYRGLSEADLLPLLRRARAVQVLCGGDPEAIVRRYVERAARGERHPGHFDSDRVPHLRELLAGGAFEPLALGVPVLRVDTTTPPPRDDPAGPAYTAYTPDFEAVLAFIRRATAP